MKHLLFVMSALLVLVSIKAVAQPVTYPFKPIRRPVPILINPALQPVGQIYIRNIRYNDHSRNSWMSPHQLVGGQFVTIGINSLNLQQISRTHQIRVVIQDVNRPPNSFGVTVFQLVNVRVVGNTLVAQTPPYPILRNKSYHLTVFALGPQPMHYAYPGVLTIH
ncbi:MAG: hypothetical protein IPM57_12455 [Oligoflexia bacterium]|nr:hypothetical protein [Oligoflexia bacterium]